MLSSALLDKISWAEALVYASRFMNKLLSTAKGGKTPLDIWSDGASQVYSLLWIFECSIYFGVKDDKLTPRAKKFVCFFVRRNLNSYKL